MYVGPLKETTTHLSMFPNKDTPCGWENEGTQERSRDVPDVVDKKYTAFSFVLYKYEISCRDVGYYNNIKRSGKYSSDFVQNFAEKKGSIAV